MLKPLHQLLRGLKILIFTYALVGCCMFQLNAQINIDSAEAQLKTHLSEEEQIATQLSLAEVYLDSNLKEAKKYLDFVESKLDEDTDLRIRIRFFIAKSIYYRIYGNPQAGKLEAFKALEIVDNHKDSLLLKSKIYNSLGSLADDESDVQTSIEYHLIALRYAEAINHQAQIATVSGGVGRAYLYLSEYETAKKHFLRAIEIKERNNQFDQNLGTYYTNLSNCFDAEGKYEESLIYINKSIELKERENNSVNIIASYNNKAYTLLLMKRLPDAEVSVLKAIHLADSLEIEVEQMYAYSTYAEILFAQNRIPMAEKLMDKSTTLGKKKKDYYLAKYNLDLLYNISLKKGDYKKALDYFQQKSVVNDSVYNVKSRSEVEKLALEYDTEKKNKEIALLNAEKEMNTLNLRKSRQFQIAFLVAAILALVVLTLLWSRHKNKVKTDKLIKESMERGFEKKLADSELQALRAQMNPHFLFNCLNSINSFIIKNEQEQASEYLAKFSKLIRRVLSNSKESKVTLANELEALELYIEMEALRFGNKFEHIIDIAPNVEVDYLEVPPLIIQPYVENSIWHGLMHKTEGKGILKIDIRQEDDLLTFTIEDNGIGRAAASELKSKSAEKHKSYGMNITKERLKYINQKNSVTTAVEVIDLKDESGESAGTRVIIKIGL